MSWAIHHGDWIEVLKTMPDESVNCVVTSPPYWNLRNYDTPPAIYGGDTDCQHVWREERWYTENTAATENGSAEAFSDAGEGNAERLKAGRWRTEEWCACGAWRGHLGLERTPELFVEHIVMGFREVFRVLRSDGTLWLNFGDSYNANGRSGHGTRTGYKQGTNRASATGSDAVRPSAPKLKAKDLIGIPWRVAFALQADGWYLRSDIIWAKQNPMPESVTDRPTKAHEYLFLMSKAERYYYDQAAILEECSPNTHARLAQDVEAQIGSARANGGTCSDRPMKALQPKSWRGSSFTDPRDLAIRPNTGRNHKLAESGSGIKSNDSFAEATACLVEKRNKRTVWEVTTQPFSEAHFATFPPKLVEPCILAGCPEGGTVLDPFNGAGTTGLVATRLGRNYVGIELNPDYIAMARKRIEQDAPLFNMQLVGD